MGKQVYLGKMHPLVISNLFASPHKNSASAASVLLIGSCEELGIPIAIHQVCCAHMYICMYMCVCVFDLWEGT